MATTLTCGSTSGIATNNLESIVERAQTVTFTYKDGSKVILSGSDFKDGVVGLLTLKSCLERFFSSTNL